MDGPRSRAIALPQGGAESALATNRVLRNTYLLLSLTPGLLGLMNSSD